MSAAQDGHAATVQVLLEAGASYERKCVAGATAMSMAIAGEHTEVIQMLRARGAVRPEATS